MVGGIKPYVMEDPKPIMMDAAIVLLDHLMQESDIVAEFGAGNSTLWFADRCEELISVEHDEDWLDTILRALPMDEKEADVTFSLSEIEDIPNALEEYPDEAFDLILVDCYSHMRPGAIKNAIPKLKTGGWLVVDDPEQPPAQNAIKRYLKNWDSILISGKKKHPISKDYAPAETQFFRKGMPASPIFEE